MNTTNEVLVNDTRLADATKLATKLGGESVKSALAKPQLYITVCRGTADGFIAEKDVKPIFDAYLAGRTKVVNANKIALGDKEDSQNGFAANLSKLMTMYKLGQLASGGIIDPPALLDKVIERREYLFAGDRKVKGTADAFVDIARAQLKTPTDEMTDEQIDEIVARPEKVEKDMLAKVIDQYKRTYKLASDMGDAMLDCTHVEAARDALADAIRALDGEVPVVGKKGKEEQEHVEFLVSKGMTRADALAFVRK